MVNHVEAKSPRESRDRLGRQRSDDGLRIGRGSQLDCALVSRQSGSQACADREGIRVQKWTHAARLIGPRCPPFKDVLHDTNPIGQRCWPWLQDDS